jgi:Raf kinase inhibitor-like YbhB/YbcL family protein
MNTTIRKSLARIFPLFVVISVFILVSPVRGYTSFKLSSPSFKNRAVIPSKHTALGEDDSPPLSWRDAPKGTVSYALIAEDPDAPVQVWAHWVIYDIPGDFMSLPEGIMRKESFPDGIKQGTNDFDQTGYSGPNPPPGKYHRYYFTLYALDKDIDLEPGLPRIALMHAIKANIIGTAELMGRFKR